MEIIKELEKVYTKNTYTKPKTPSTWLTAPNYIPITRIDMSCGGGMCGSRWYEYVNRIDTILPNQFITVTRAMTGKSIIINTNNIVDCENFTIAHVTLDSKNPNFSHIYDVYVLTECDSQLKFI